MRRCRQLLRDEQEALDGCQDVFVRVIEHRRHLDARYPSSLLYRIATNVCLNRIRDRRRAAASSTITVGENERIHEIACAGAPHGNSDARMLLDWLFKSRLVTQELQRRAGLARCRLALGKGAQL